MSLTVNDFPIGQKVGAIWRNRKENGDTFQLVISKVSNISTNKNGTKIKTSPKMFRYALDIDEFDDYRERWKDRVIIIDTPLLLSDEAVEYLQRVVKSWNVTPQKSIFD